MKPLSIITVNLNNRDGLAKTLAGIASQVFTNYELIVIDGGSTDGSLILLESYEKIITRRISEKDRGVYEAMNKGIHLAQGEYLLFLNSGDFLADSRVLLDIFGKTREADIVYGNMIIDYGNGRRKAGTMPPVITFHHMIRDTLWHPVSFIRKELFTRFGLYDESLKIVGDYDFFLKSIIVHQASTKYVNRIISVFNTSGMSSLPANRLLQLKERKAVQERYFPGPVIETAKAYNKLLGSRWYRLLTALKII